MIRRSRIFCGLLFLAGARCRFSSWIGPGGRSQGAGDGGLPRAHADQVYRGRSAGTHRAAPRHDGLELGGWRGRHLPLGGIRRLPRARTRACSPRWSSHGASLRFLRQRHRLRMCTPMIVAMVAAASLPPCLPPRARFARTPVASQRSPGNPQNMLIGHPDRIPYASSAALRVPSCARLRDLVLRIASVATSGRSPHRPRRPRRQLSAGKRGRARGRSPSWCRLPPGYDSLDRLVGSALLLVVTRGPSAPTYRAGRRDLLAFSPDLLASHACQAGPTIFRSVSPYLGSDACRQTVVRRLPVRPCQLLS